MNRDDSNPTDGLHDREAAARPTTPLDIAYRRHDRHWRDNRYCYAVVSRRSGGLSVGVNLNPDKACNFDCIYCQVDRTTPPTTRKVVLDILTAELDLLLRAAGDGSLFAESPYDAIPSAQRVVRDIALSGDGEPTTYARFDEAVQRIADCKAAHGLTNTKIVLITDAAYLTMPAVRHGLAIMDDHNGEIWAKLDAGTDAYYEIVNRPNVPLAQVLENIIDAARVRPVVIQSLWMRIHGDAPPDDEVRAFAERLNAIRAADGAIRLVQVYTIARQTTEAYATPLSRAELDRVATIIGNHAFIPIETYYGVGAE
jgi:wyosine [tRNA(Phe)-imidazoG37] synthetase (radical SAM superfamily)